MPNLTSSSTPGEIEIDIDALDAGTLRALERFVKSCIHKKSKKKSTPTIPPVPLAETGTTKRIRDVERQLKEITEKSQALNRSKGGTVKPDNMEVDSTNPPVQETKKEESSSSDSDSSDSSSSDTESGSSDSSGTESESEKKKKEVQTETPIITSTMMDIIEPPAPLPSVPNEAAPKILSSAPAVKKDVVIQNVDSWTKLDGGASAKSDSQSSSALWSSFKSKEQQHKLKEKEREEQEERSRKQKEERDEEMRKKRKEFEKQEARTKKQRLEAEAAASAEAQRKREAMRQAAKAEREKVNGSGVVMMNEQSNLMKSFEETSLSGIMPTTEVLGLSLKKVDEE